MGGSTAATNVPPPGLRRSWWLREALAAERDPPAVMPDADGEFDVVIIGGGYTGLWTAYLVTERDPSARIAIVEQDICGGGPSGRNGGFLHGWWEQLPLLVELFGSERALELARAADEAVEGTREVCDRHAIDAWFRPSGYLRVSASTAQDGDWRLAVETCRRLGAGDEYVELTSDEVRARCASPAFRGGALMRNAATIQPARLARGLRRVLLERGVVIHEQTRALGLDMLPARVAVRTSRGRLTGDQVVLAVNAWAPGWHGFRTALVAWGSYIALTAPAPDRLRELGWSAGEAIADSRFTVHYFRTTPDGRVAFGAGVGPAGYGGRIGRGFERDQRAVVRAVEGMRRLLPPFADVEVEEAWGGPIDVSGDRLPIIGSRGRVHYAFGYSGNGVGPSRLAGRILAARICGADDSVTRLAIVDRSWRRFPPEPFRSVGARLIREALIRSDELADREQRSGVVVQALSRLPRWLGYRLGSDGDAQTGYEVPLQSKD